MLADGKYPSEVAKKFAAHFPDKSYAALTQCIKRHEAKGHITERAAKVGKSKVIKEVKKQLETEIAEVKAVKGQQERIDEIYDLAMRAARHCVIGDNGKLLPRESCDMPGFRGAIAEARAVTALLGKPEPIQQQQTTIINNNLSKLSDDELKELEKITAKLEGSTPRESKATSS